MKSSPKEILQSIWGYPDFRPLQEDIINDVLAGKDTLALMPTGGGKSLCYQVPAMCQEGVTIVVSPLIALMKDQVTRLKALKIPAAAIFSGMHYKDIDRTFDNAVYGHLKLLYLSPERLLTELAIERIKQMKVNLLAVDEAHCISQWGYDFRPAYLQIATLRTYLPSVPVLALTATATQKVVDDIQEKLNFNPKHVLQKSFARSNLSYSVLTENNKLGKLLEIVKKVNGSGIIYVNSRRKTKEIAVFLHRRGIKAHYYHAGLESEVRTKRQEAWMNNEIRVIVSTNAFGMGIDKPDVRFVVHLDLPNNLEAYFQEAGRAGRDGEKAYAVLLYNASDKERLELQYRQSFPEEKEIRQVYRALGSYLQLAAGSGKGESYDFDISRFCKHFGLEPVKTFHCLKILETSEWLTLSEAIYWPSSLKIKVDKQQLYDFQLKHPQSDRLLKTILRTYQGAFQHPIFFKERQLAHFLKQEINLIKKQLSLLHKEQIIDYVPQKENPQITFNRERVSADQLMIDRVLYQQRKTLAQDRLQAALRYAEQPICRSVQLLGYFGEITAQKCGICDVCLGRTKASLDESTYHKLKQKVLLLLKREQLSTQEIVDSFSPKWEAQLLQTLTYMEDEGFIVSQAGKFTKP